MMFFSFAFAETRPVQNRAILVEGTLPRAGIPGFGPNTISSLYGKYEVASGATITVRATNEHLVFNPSIWTKRKTGKYYSWYTQSVDKSRIWTVQREIAQQSESGNIQTWSFVFRFSEDSEDQFCVKFIDTFITRAEPFFLSARHPSDLSFPAILQYD